MKVLLIIVGIISWIALSTENVLRSETVTFNNCTADDLLNYERYEIAPNQLNITECTLETIPNFFFLRFLTVTTLAIVQSNTVTIEEYALNGLRHLQALSLAGNSLMELRPWSDHNFDKLESLDLSANRIVKISINGLKRYPNVISLNMESNRIESWSEMESVFNGTTHIEELNLGHNRLNKIEAHMFRELTDLIELLLHSNNIESIEPFALSTNIRLKSLRLDGNELIVFDALLSYSLPRLHYLNLSHNHLNDISEKTFQKNLELKVLDLSCNELVELKNYAFAGLQTLEVLNVSNNKIDVLLPLSFQQFGKLKILNYASNRLDYLFDGVIDSLVSLEELNLSNNLIDEIENNVFDKQEILHTLDLSHNRLASDEFLMKLPSLRHLNMNRNQFEKLNLTLLFHLNTAELIGNPWKCSWLIVEMMRASNGFRFGQNYTIDSEDLVLTVPGIDCTDDNGMNRSIVMLQQVSTKNAIGKISASTESPVLSSRSFVKFLDNDFDYKSCLIWTAIGVIVVFGGVQIGKVFLRKSEKKSEEWRLKQQLNSLNTPSSIHSGKYRNTQICFTPISHR